MPAINVARTDTFEVQRQKINQIGSQIFAISAGGSDLSTGILKLGNGSVPSPSLAFTSDSTLGLYKSDVGTLGLVSNNKSIIDFNQQGVYSFQDILLRQRVLDNAGLSILNSGQNYDVGLYENLSISGGSGSGATANVIVASFGGSVTTVGQNYTKGIHNNIQLLGGNGTGATAFFTVSNFSGSINNSGTGYIPGTYENVTITGGSGSNASGTVTISGGISYSGTINSGTGNNDATYTDVEVRNVATQTFVVTTTSNGSPPPDNLYQIDGVTQDTLSLEKGNTYVFDVSDSSMIGHPLDFSTVLGSPLSTTYYSVSSYGNSGNTGSFVELVIKNDAPSEQILYYCQNHSGMGGSANISVGTPLYYGTGASANIVVSGGVVTSFTMTGGEDYKANDIVYVPSIEIGQGSGVQYTISGITYSGTVISLEVTDQGTNYVLGDTVGIDSADVGGQGSGFSYILNNTPGVLDDISFISRGTGYQIGDVLTLPGPVNNITSSLRGFVDTTAAFVNGSPVITLSATTGIVSGMNVTVSDSILPPGSTVLTVDSSTQVTLSQSATNSATDSISFRSNGDLNIATVSSTAGIFQNYLVEKVSGSGELDVDTIVAGVNSSNNTVTLSKDPLVAGDIVLNFIPSYGIPTTDFDFTIDVAGAIDSVVIVDGGNGYVAGDLVSIDAADLKAPISNTFDFFSVVDVTFTSTVPAGTFTVGQNVTAAGYTLQIREVIESGGNTDYIVVDYEQTFISGETLTYSGTPYVTDTVSAEKGRFSINGITTPNLTLYVGNTYQFVEANPQPDDTNPDFSFSTFPGGEWGSSLVSNVATTLSVTSSDITVLDSTNIVTGMAVTVVSGDGALFANTEVSGVNGNTITLSKPPQASGSSILDFKGKEYTDNVTKSVDEETESVVSTIKITDSTPSTLYYYSKNGADFGGSPTGLSVLTIDPNNPATLGSGLSISVVDVVTSDIISGDIVTGDFSAIKFISEELEVTNASVTETLTSDSVTSNTLGVNIIRFSDPTITNTPIQVFSKIDLLEDVAVGSSITLSSSSGDISTSGDIDFSGTLTSNQFLSIKDNIISSLQSKDLILKPATNRITKVDSNSAFIIPSGNNSSRPSSATGTAEDGAIRFNTESQQYEGYSSNTDSWSSLGGVRDLDGNTTILAEESIGVNDNTLWFINDSVNTIRITPQYHEYVNVKKVRSVNVNAPDYVTWTSSTPVFLGNYLKYRNNIYEVTSAGTTGTSGNEPIHTSGALPNGSAELTYFTTAAAALTFEEISEVRIDPLGFTDLVVNNELRFSQQTISSTNNDIIIQPSGSNKVEIKGTSSLVVPVGDNNQKGAPKQGSIRYNTSDSQFEGYNGAQWGGLGGVKDVDQDTRIDAETGPGNDEDILYFFNAGSNTLRLTTTQLEFDSIDTIASGTSDSLNINAATITFDSLATTIDNTDSTISFITTSKDNLDFGLSTGLNNDHLLRLKDTGEVVFNLGFGTGTPVNLTLLNDHLTNFELKHTRVNTSKIPLVRGALNSGNSTVYSIATESSAKVCLTAHNTTTGDKELVEYYVIDNGTDVYFTDYNNVKTGTELVSTVFDIDPSNNVRMTVTLSTGLTIGDNVTVTLIKTVTKR